MTSRLPPLNALRAFEAAARHLSFVKAAEELHVTPAAISHQVKGLEEQLGVALFTRLPRGLVLGDAGRAMLPELARGFDHFARAVRGAVAGDVAGELRITMIPSFAQLWLLPRLQRFIAAYPDVRLTMQGSAELVDLARSDIDLGIRYGGGHYPGLWSRLLFTEETFPVCAPALLDGPPPLRRPADLRHHRLLSDWDITSGEAWLTWAAWAGHLGQPDLRADDGLRLSDSMMLMEAAVSGLGVAIGRTSLAAGHLAAGRLVRPFAITKPADYAYYVVAPEGSETRPRIRAFVDWLMEEVRRDQG
ncbi:MAG TPA: transcriptional regulator GcvA [Geminicoccaceae bacterium]|nr:transcriptional regulator GcvA [Geminicoccus sp.]HMU52918.1 transcriptional regulator GcvA [Geminicoccaceae bacterium]